MEDKIICTYNDVHRLCNILLDKFDSLLTPMNISYIAAVSRGGLLPGVILSHKLNLPLYPIVWSTRDHNQQIYYGDIVEDLWVGQNVLIIDDINDTGKTFIDLIADWEYNKRTESGKIWTASLYKRYTTKHDSFFFGEFIEDDRWVVFPWEA
jgi:hypoxanthine phosphoribosyltransferase